MAAAENGTISLPFSKQLLSWAGAWVGKRERIVYSSEVPNGSHLVDIAEIWAREFNRPELVKDIGSRQVPAGSSGLAQVQKALKHSFRVSTAYAEITEIKNGEVVCTSRKLIGCARCVSDGYFAAQIVDCCVDVAYQRRGIGTKLLRSLCTETRAAGAQSIAVFSAPDSRLFFWKAGFRMDFRCDSQLYFLAPVQLSACIKVHVAVYMCANTLVTTVQQRCRYKIMVYDALKPAPIASTSEVRSSDVSVEELSKIFGARR
ncbi:MAG: GNAT family N-acetyltransferase [Akkermansiaceae bacterium]|nr:GNAT family N-acetyltransferase [Akkermansiaceae bacterium]